MKKSTYPTNISELPDGEHFAALVEESYTVEDGDRSWTSQAYLQYVVLGNSEQALEWMRQRDESTRRYGANTAYAIISVKRPTVRRTTTFELE